MPGEEELINDSIYIKACDQLIVEYNEKLMEIRKKMDEVEVSRAKELIRNQARFEAGSIDDVTWNECRVKIIEEKNIQLRGLKCELDCADRELGGIRRMKDERDKQEEGLMKCSFVDKLKCRNKSIVERKKLLEETVNFIRGYYQNIKTCLCDEIEYTDCICDRKAQDEFLRFTVYGQYIAFKLNENCIDVVISADKTNPYDRIVVNCGRCESLCGSMVNYELLNRYMFRAFEQDGHMER